MLHRVLETSLQAWDAKAIETLLKVLYHIPFEIETLAKNSLGFLIKDVKREAITRENTLLIERTSTLIDKWKELQKRSTHNLNGKREMSEQSSQSSASTNELPRKQVKLAIQKEPPARAKAMADPNFFSNLKEVKKITPNTRPVYHVDRILENISKTDKGESSTNSLKKRALSANNIALNAYSATGTTSVSDSTGVKRAAMSEMSLASKVPDPNRKRVRFKENLVEIREYERNPEEWTSFDIPEEFNQYNQDMTVIDGLQLSRPSFPPPPQINWYTPYELVFDADANPNLVIPKSVRSSETIEQERREKRALAATYISPQHIPPAPAEPDELPNANEDGNVPIIPLTDTDMPTVTTPSTATTTISPSSINALASGLNVAAAMKEPQVTQSQQQYNAAPNHTNISYYSSAYTPAQQQQQQSPSTTPVMNAAPAKTTQPEITNQAVENMLKNTPGIMQQLKQLSFLANGGTFGAVSNPQPVANPQPTVNLQPAINPEPQTPYHAPQHNYGMPQQTQYHHQVPNQPSNWDRPNETYANNQMANRNKKPKRPSKKNIRGNNRTPCNFYYTAEGCRNGDNCPFSH
ncbi:hypothetical protein A0J61_00215 [Choanephora cucurbitarum]|uniref:C3H1-type domain-containing protein n=1 Tax=Choanephora cucurbitarum TaxID=101091 RepID=A0A1C7NRK8_9FUNG|nr:hypothetical protein A0J61_00215 [Choanephora cucurbitarum]